MKYLTFSLQVKDSAGNSLLDDTNDVKLVNFVVTYSMNYIPRLELNLQTLNPIEFPKDLIISINKDDVNQEYNMGVIETTVTDGGIIKFSGLALPYDNLEVCRTRYLGSDIVSAINSLGLGYTINSQNNPPLDVYQMNESDIDVLNRLVLGLNADSPVLITENTISLYDIDAADTINVEGNLGDLIIRSKYASENIRKIVHGDYITYYGKDFSQIVRNEETDYFSNYYSNLSYQDSMEITQSMEFSEYPRLKLGDVIVYPNSYFTKKFFIISLTNNFKAAGGDVATSIIIGTKNE